MPVTFWYWTCNQIQKYHSSLGDPFWAQQIPTLMSELEKSNSILTDEKSVFHSSQSLS
jgi:hypothetical protein